MESNKSYKIEGRLDETGKGMLLKLKIKFKIISNFLRNYFNKTMVLFYYDKSPKKEVMQLIDKWKKEREMALLRIEAYNLYSLIKSLSKIDGDIAEIGCYRGGSSRVICEAKGDKTFYIFDTFEGLPNLDKNKDKVLCDGKWGSNSFVVTSLNHVKDYLKDFKNVNIHKGIFPKKTGYIVNAKKFSFVHLDVDTYDSVLNCLRFFYPRMNEGGVIICHDNDYVGVQDAFRDFFKDKPEPYINYSASYFLFMKIKGVK